MSSTDVDQQIEIWKMKRLIKSLSLARGSGTSMISLVMPPKDQISIMNNTLTNEYGTASNIKSRVNRLSVLSAITSAQQCLKHYSRVPPKGLVVYCGTILTDEGKEKKVSIHFEPFKPINTSLYLCDNKFHVEALQELLDNDSSFGFIIIDGNGCLYGRVTGNTREVITHFSVDLPKKHGRGGQSAQRFGRIREEKRHHYLRKVAETATQVFISNNRVNDTGIILAGSAEFKNDLMKSDLFDPRMRAKVVNIVDVSYGGVNGFDQAISLSQECLSNVKLVQETKLIEKLFDEISLDTGKYAYGIDDTLKALDMGAVETLIVWESLDVNRVMLNGPDGIEVERFFTPAQEADRSNYVDKETGAELEVKEKMPMLEWLTEIYKEKGASLEFVTDRSTVGSQFVKGFGGMGGLLRYKMDVTTLEGDDNDMYYDDDEEIENDDDDYFF
ncbi:translation termination factor eRF1 [Coemansia aciculifera]|uniref:Eukaryotic peptide chain release factor subunit 1 n=2 Tax=Coemansia TaxID=4863 RepID=A0A9W8H244_9FUNG|nr:translation termination factor eRF1 [Coemansia pectinata]KAJ2868508.1 translation termination factor eRF1 [Coemansia aciculifera]KAJ2877282.1 translation termination factor eRF1 [Coemansia aciculifera]KAJ2883696.1 translation termination factor eRF1 [Coemansia aciculifera]